MIALDGDKGRGSGRSIEAFDLLAGLTACGEHLLGYGGHRAAAGWRSSGARVEAFAAALSHARGSVLRPQDLIPVERVDAIVRGEELGMALAEELQSLAPFGRGNPTVSLLLADAVFATPGRWAKAARALLGRIGRCAGASGRVWLRRAPGRDAASRRRRRSRWRSTSGTA